MSMSFIEEHEEGDAQDFINNLFTEITGEVFDMKPAGYMIAVKLYTREMVTEGGIIIPDVVLSEDKYQSCSALVCAMGPEAYKGEKFERSGPWCKVGDWVMIPRYEAVAVSYRGVALGLIPDDRIMAVIKDPRDVESVKNADRF
jgi:co-chaperonin GroES (HSP10)